MTARLTIDQVRVGMKVVCVDDDLWGAPRIRAGETYEIEGFGWEGHVHLRGQNKRPNSGWNINRFIPAPALPAMTAELVEALREWGSANEEGGSHDWLPPLDARLWQAIVSTPGILAPVQPSPPGVTGVQPTLQWEWLL